MIITKYRMISDSICSCFYIFCVDMRHTILVLLHLLQSLVALLLQQTSDVVVCSLLKKIVAAWLDGICQ